MADALERGVEVGDGSEAQRALAEVAGGEHRSRQARDRAKWSVSPGWTFFAGLTSADQSLWLGGEPLREQDFDVAAGRGRVVLRGEAARGGEEARGKHAGVVEDQQVAGLEQRGQVGEVVVGEGAGAAVERHHAAAAAHRGRLLRDEVFGEVVVEVGDEHKGRV